MKDDNVRTPSALAVGVCQSIEILSQYKPEVLKRKYLKTDAKLE